MFIDFLQFICQLILANFVLRYLQVKLTAKNKDAARALAFVS